eukprot:3533928-Rhodomonas_salina.4
MTMLRLLYCRPTSPLGCTTIQQGEMEDITEAANGMHEHTGANGSSEQNGAKGEQTLSVPPRFSIYGPYTGWGDAGTPLIVPQERSKLQRSRNLSPHAPATEFRFSPSVSCYQRGYSMLRLKRISQSIHGSASSG